MNNYELTIVLPGEVTPAKKKAVLGETEKIIKTNKGKIVKTDEWGKLDLAYEINDETTGVFLHMNLELGGDTVKNLKDKLRLDDDIIRYLLVRVK